MTPVKRIHHINFIYANLEAAVAQFEQSLNLGPFEYDELPGRGVRTARVKLGGTYLVLVSPVSSDGAPARYLAENGEGFFLLSFEVDELESALANLECENAEAVLAGSRRGLEGWRVADLPTDLAGCFIQLTETSKADQE